MLNPASGPTANAPSRSHAEATIEREKRRMYSIGLVIAIMAAIPPTVYVVVKHEDHFIWHILLNGAVTLTNTVLLVLAHKPGRMKWVERGMTALTLGYVFAWDIINLTLHRFPLQDHSGEDPIILIGILMLVFAAPPRLAKALVLTTYGVHIALKWANLSLFPWSTAHIKLLITDLIVAVCAIIVVVFATYSQLVWKTSNESDRLRRLTQTDTLDGLPNRRALLAQFNTEQLMTVMICDIDRFAELRRTGGQYCGDVALHAVADCLLKHFHDCGTVGRWGGEEFIVIVPSANPARALQLIEQAHADVATAPLAPQITFSTGMTVQRPSESLTELLLRCDGLLYLAKQQGGNEVMTDWHATSLPSVAPVIAPQPGDPCHDAPEPSHPLF